MPRPEVWWLVRCQAPAPDYPVTAATAAELAGELAAADRGEQSVWLRFPTVPGGYVVIRSDDICALEEWTPAVRAHIEEERAEAKRADSEGWRP